MKTAAQLLAISAGMGVLLALPEVLRTEPAARPASYLLKPPAPDYQAYLLDRLDFVSQKYFRQTSSLLKGTSHIHAVALMAGSEVRAWQWTGEQKYADAAVDHLRLIAGKIDDVKQVDFFTPYPLATAYQGLAAKGLIDDRLKQQMERFVAKTFAARDETSLNNQTLTRACGLELASQLWPHLEQAASWHAYALKIFALLEAIEDVPENSPNYNTFDLVCTFVLADLLQRKDLLARPGIRAMFLRYRDQVSPLGWIPPYGDAGSASRPFDPSWPMNSPWAAYVAAFERAAREYRDPTLRWAATRMAAAGERRQPLGRHYADVADLFYMSHVVEWCGQHGDSAPSPKGRGSRDEIEPQEPRTGSAVLMRRDAHGKTVRDKLILAPSRREGAPFVLSDLYTLAMHDHDNQHGAIDYFEFAGQPLLTTLGYNNRGPEHANLVLFRREDEPFPHVPNLYEPNTWYEAALPTSRLPIIDPKRPHIREIDSVTLRITAGRRGVTFWAGKMELTGPDGDRISLDAFSIAPGWRGRPAPIEEGSGPERALRWDFPPGVHFIRKPDVRRTFDCRDHPTLTLRWKLSNNDERARPAILRVGHDFHLHTAQLEPILARAQIDGRGDDQYAVLAFGSWFTPDTKLQRQVLLTRSGVLVVRDLVAPGPLASGLVGGPIWHLAPTSEPRAGPHWFSSTGGKLGLLVVFEEAAGRTFGCQTVEVWSKTDQRTVFASQAIKPGSGACFVSVLVPYREPENVSALAEGIEIEKTPGGGSSVRVERGGEVMRIEFTNFDWKISRTVKKESQ